MQEKRETSNNIIPDQNFLKRRTAYRFFNMLSVTTDWYFYFVWMSLIAFLKLISYLAGIKVTKELETFFYYIAFPAALCSFKSDILSVDPLSKADAQAKNTEKSTNAYKALVFVSFISYILSGFANASFIPGINSGVASNSLRIFLNILGFVFVSGISIFYNHMFNDDSLRNNLNTAANIRKNPSHYWQKFKNNKGACFEAGYQSLLVNPIYRAIKDAAAVINGLPLFIPSLRADSATTLLLAFTAMIATSSMTATCRSDATFKKHIPEDNKYINIADYSYFQHLTKIEKGKIFGTSFLRAITLGYIMFYATSNDYYLNFIVGGLVFSLMGALSHMGLTEEALYAKARNALPSREKKIAETFWNWKHTEKNNNAQSNLSPEQRFDQFAREKFAKPWILSYISKNNWISRGTRFVTFPVFVYNLATAYYQFTYGEHTSKRMSIPLLLSFWIAFGLPILATDKDNYDYKVTQNLLRYVAKCYLEILIFKANSSHLSYLAYPFCYAMAVLKAIFVKSIYDYDVDAIINSANSAPTENSSLLANNNNQTYQDNSNTGNYSGYSAPKGFGSYVMSFFAKPTGENNPQNSLSIDPQQV